MNDTSTYRLRKIQRQYFLIRLLEVLCLGAAAGIAIFSLAQLAGLKQADTLVLSGTVGVTLFLWQLYRLGLHQLSLQRMASYLNKQHPHLEWSSELLLTPASQLSGLQLLQRQKALSQLEEMPKPALPNHLVGSVLLLAVASSLLFLLPALKQQAGLEPASVTVGNDSTTSPGEKTLPPIEVKGFSIAINPPAYTGLKISTTTQPNLKIAEGSAVNWRVGFSAKPRNAFFVFSGRDTVTLKESGDLFSASRQIVQSGFYQLVWQHESEYRSSDFFKIEMVADAEPKVSIKNIPQFQDFEWTDKIQVPVLSEIVDDYGLTDAYIIATVTKGSGESVKFREEKLSFDRPSSISGKRIEAQRLLGLQKLGLEPGDELYFYVQAWDNKRPTSQGARTETYFLQIKDTASYITSSDGGLGVDLMPEYFRSQRQIIIDSEKLVTERGKVKKQEFDSRSNNLAHDQKVLRLRYGQFMGEEFESGMTAADTENNEEGDSHEGDEEVDVLKEYGHAHDTENEHNLVPHNNHDHAPARPDEKEDPLEAFAHMHDSEEEATFFIQSVKAKLRAALSLMWDAELHLRMNSPEQSLPYQYKILKLLKEISNDSRIYVHRTGFDPPPIKEEKRLSGDLSEVKPSRRSYNTEQTDSLPHIRKAVPLIEKLLAIDSVSLTAYDKEVLSNAGVELAQVALEQPGKHLESMSFLKNLIEGKLPGEDATKALLLIRQSLWNVLPEEATHAASNTRSVHATDQKLMNKLEKAVNE